MKFDIYGQSIPLIRLVQAIWFESKHVTIGKNTTSELSVFPKSAFSAEKAMNAILTKPIDEKNIRIPIPPGNVQNLSGDGQITTIENQNVA